MLWGRRAGGGSGAEVGKENSEISDRVGPKSISAWIPGSWSAPSARNVVFPLGSSFLGES